MAKSLKKKEWIFYFILLVITIGICFPYLKMKSISTTDEFVSIAIPYQLAGAEWGDIISSRNWHGYGTTIILVPFLRFLDAGMIMPAFLILGIIVRSACVLITYFISNHICKVKGTISFFISLIVAFGFLGNCTYGETNILQELPMVLICLLVALLMFQNKLQWYRTVIAAILSGYLVLIHSRYIVVCFSLFIVLLLKCCLEKRGYLNILIFVTVVGIGVLGFNHLNSEVTRMCFSNHAKTVSNTVNSMTKTKSLFAYFERLCRNGIWEIFRMILGLLASFTFWSLGLIWVAILVCFKSIKSALKSKKMLEPEHYIGLFGIAMFFVMIILLTVIAMEGKGEKLYRNYMLVRYAMPFTWMIILGGAIILSKGIHEYKKEVIVSGLISVFLEISFIDVLAKWFDSENYLFRGSPFRYFLLANEFEWESFIQYFDILTKLTVVLFVLLLLCLTEKKLLLITLLYLALSGVYIIGNYNYFVFRTNSILYPKIEESKKIVAEISEDLTPSDYTIYYSGTDFYTMLLRMEFPFKEMKYIEDFEEIDISGNYILLTDDITINPSQSFYELDESEFILTNMDVLKERNIFNEY